MEKSIKIPQKIKTRTTIQFSNSTSAYVSEWNEIVTQKDMHPNVHWNIIYSSQDMEAIYVPMDRWMDKEEWNTTQHKKERNNAICSNMDGPRDYHTKWSKSDRERQIPYDITYMWNLKKMIQMNLYTKHK